MASKDPIRDLLVIAAKRRGRIDFKEDKEYQTMVIDAIRHYNDQIAATDRAKLISAMELGNDG